MVVVGGGYIGLEMAEAFVRWGAEVTLVEGGDQLMGTLDPDMAGAAARSRCRGMGIDVRLGMPVAGFEPGQGAAPDGRRRVAGRPRRARPRRHARTASWPPRPASSTGASGAIVVDRRQRTSLDGVWAAGDCCESFHLVSGRPVHIALGTVANKQGRVAGINIGGGYATFPGVVGTAITKVCDAEVGRTGLTEREAAAGRLRGGGGERSSRRPGPATSPTPSRSR